MIVISGSCARNTSHPLKIVRRSWARFARAPSRLVYEIPAFSSSSPGPSNSAKKPASAAAVVAEVSARTSLPSQLPKASIGREKTSDL
jgi:hypothetical protein